MQAALALPRVTKVRGTVTAHTLLKKTIDTRRYQYVGWCRRERFSSQCEFIIFQYSRLTTPRSRARVGVVPAQLLGDKKHTSLLVTIQSRCSENNLTARTRGRKLGFSSSVADRREGLQRGGVLVCSNAVISPCYRSPGSPACTRCPSGAGGMSPRPLLHLEPAPLAVFVATPPTSLHLGQGCANGPT